MTSFELAIEIGYILKTGSIANLEDRLASIDQLAYRNPQALVDDIVADRLVGTELEEMAESRRRHIG